MANSDQATVVQSNLRISDEVAQEFPELVKMIQESNSMNDEERQYWVDALPIMSEDQIENLVDILKNEKDEIEEAETEYRQATAEATQKASIDFDSEKYKEKKELLKKAEQEHEAEEQEHEEAILKEIEGM